MRCPKCGFTGFDHIDNCRKCGRDLTAFKARFGLRPPLVADAPFVADVPPVSDPPQPVAIAREVPPAAVSSAEATDFGYNFMDEPSAASPAAAKPFPPEETEDEFSFEEMSGDFGLDEAQDEDFPLETTSVTEGATEEKDQALSVDSGEFMDLELDLSWDEKPTVAAEMPTAAPSALDGTDDFELPSLDDLPPLEGNPPLEEEAFGEELPDDLGDLPEFDGFDLNDPVDQPGKKGDPRDPFEYRGHVSTEHAPGNPSPGDPEPSRHSENALETPEAETALPCGVPETSASPSSFESEETFSRQDPSLPEEAPAQDELPPSEFTDPDSFHEEPEPVAAAPLSARLAATAADGAILLAGFLLFVSAGEYVQNPAGGRILPSFDSLPDLLIPYFLVLFFLGFCYFTLFHFLLGQTVGKMLLGLRVESLEGDSLLFSQAFLRSAGGCLSLLAAGLGFLRLLSDGRGWNDRLAGTHVVRASNGETLLQEVT